METYENAVFISYAWGEEREQIVNEIDKSLQTRGLKIVRDKRALEYRGSIKKFMERIGRGDCVIVVVSDKYLKSPNCMYELVEIAESKDFEKRIFPVVLADADIYKTTKQIDYIKYWEDQIRELKEKIATVDQTHLEGPHEQLNLYDRIRDNISRLTVILSDMNTLTPDMHREADFDALYDAIEKRMKESYSKGVTMPKSESFQGNEPAQKSTVIFNQGNQTVTNQENIGRDKIINAKNYIQGGQNNQIVEGATLREVFDGLNQLIEKLPIGVEKNVAETAIQGLREEAEKGEQADEGKVKKFMRFLLDAAPDIWEVAVSTFLNPVAGIGTVFKKIAERAKAETAHN